MGFLVSLGTILAPPVAGMIAFASFVHWQSALVFVLGIGFVSFLAVRFHNHHHRSEAYDDRLTDSVMLEAQEYIIRRWENKNVED